MSVRSSMAVAPPAVERDRMHTMQICQRCSNAGKCRRAGLASPWPFWGDPYRTSVMLSVWER
jgi:hypothetical protein